MGDNLVPSAGLSRVFRVFCSSVDLGPAVAFPCEEHSVGMAIMSRRALSPSTPRAKARPLRIGDGPLSAAKHLATMPGIAEKLLS